MKLESNISQFFEKFPEFFGRGSVDSLKKVKKLPKKIRDFWYLELLSKYPIANSEIGIPNDYGQEELKGKPIEELPLMKIQFLGVNELIEVIEYEDNVMGHVSSGNIPVAFEENTASYVFVSLNESDSTPRLIIHEFDSLFDEDVLFDSFSDIFKYGRPLNGAIPLDVDLQKVVISRMKDFINEIEELSKTENHPNFEKDEMQESFDAMHSLRLMMNPSLSEDFLFVINAMYDNNMPVSQKQLQELNEIFDLAKFHKAPLCYLKENLITTENND